MTIPLTDPVLKLSAAEARGFWEVPVLYEDEQLLALDKPAGLPTAPDPDAPEQPSLMRLLHEGITGGKPWARARGLNYLANVHRLDADVSGVLLFVKTKPALAALANLFGTEKPMLHFLALVQGTPPTEEFSVEARIAPHSVRPGVMCVDSDRGKKSRTLFKIRERFQGWTLLECIPLTHRQHQVRVHLRHARVRVAGDPIYGGPPLLLSQLKPGFRLKPGHVERALLGSFTVHAETLVIPHPVTGEELRVTASWPKDLTVAIKYLRRYAA